MARLETQINQIYLTHSEGKKNSLILYEEQLTNSLQLFIVAELWNMEKKSEGADLKKISEIILQSFRGNRKLPAETLFEISLSQINQNLADIAHEGRKSWVGKFSCVICVKGADNNIYLANNGQTCAYLKRKSELVEVLPHEKRGNHPLKTFINFTQGKLTDNDSLILTTANIFNYISFELFSRLLDQHPLDEAATEITKILQGSMSPDLAFSAFLMHFTKKPLEEMAAAPAALQEIYAPSPEEIEEPAPRVRLPMKFAVPNFSAFRFSMLKIPSLNWEWLKKIRFPYFQNLSRAAKFFFLSFAVFLLLFLINLGIYAGKARTKKSQTQIAQLVSLINDDLAATQSALIYKDETQALKQLNKTLSDWDLLATLSQTEANQLLPKIEQVKTVINKINTVTDLKVFLDLKHHPIYLSNTSIGFLFANQDSNSLSLYKNQLTDYFLLNSLKAPITGITYFPPAGVVVSTGDQIYQINSTLKQFEPLVTITGQSIKQIKFANSNLYTMSNTQITKTVFSKNKYQTVVSITADLSLARDMGIDKDIYVLFADKVIKYVSGQAQAFPMPNMTDSLTNGTRLLDLANLYILEANKKRLLILNKNGTLINQIYFPQASTPTDFYVDESSRSIYLLDDNKLYKITF